MMKSILSMCNDYKRIEDLFNSMIQKIKYHQKDLNFTIFLSALMYASSILVYLENQKLYSVETIFYEDVLEKPIQIIKVSY